MNSTPSALYRQALPTDLKRRLNATIEKGCKSAETQPVRILFRADDIGVPSAKFTQLIRLFQKYEMPLCLATVPSWLTHSRFARLEDITGRDRANWCWHQHGRLHRNFEPTGKKQEFGPAREYSVVKQHIQKGKERLGSIMGDTFEPFFTPPWNRCSLDTIRSLGELGFYGLSRSKGAKPESSSLLPDIQVNVDLHTKKETDPIKELNAILNELETSLCSGYAGIMIHHQRMNNRAFTFLDLLLNGFKKQPTIRPVLFRDFIVPSE